MTTLTQNAGLKYWTPKATTPIVNRWVRSRHIGAQFHKMHKNKLNKNKCDKHLIQCLLEFCTIAISNTEEDLPEDACTASSVLDACWWDANRSADRWSFSGILLPLLSAFRPIVELPPLRPRVGACCSRSDTQDRCRALGSPPVASLFDRLRSAWFLQRSVQRIAPARSRSFSLPLSLGLFNTKRILCISDNHERGQWPLQQEFRT